MVTVMFTDFKDFSFFCQELPPESLVAEVNRYFSVFDRIMDRYGIEKIKTIGDIYMCAGGLPEENDSHPQDVMRAAVDIQKYVADQKKKNASLGKPYFELRIGVHTGSVVAGIVGKKKFAYDIWGDTVNMASRMESTGEVGKVNLSQATYELVKDSFPCTYRGKIAAKNKGIIDMYFLDPAD
jgi:class 3 adenylate cyclase